MAYLNPAYSSSDHHYGIDVPIIQNVPDASRTLILTESERDAVMEFLNKRPVHTVAMTSFINDNGIESPLNRGRFYGYYNLQGDLEGVALIGHSTLVEARTDEALRALALAARTPETPIHLVMSGGTAAETFWQYMTGGISKPRLTCTESLFEINFPFLVSNCSYEIRNARPEELLPVAEAQTEIAFMECGIDPMTKDREGFLTRVARRIEQGRVFVVVEDGKLLFKADIIAETEKVIYLEGIYVAPESRRKGLGSQCLAKLSLELMSRAETVCLLSNVDFKNAHKCYEKAGYRNTDMCTTLFV